MLQSVNNLLPDQGVILLVEDRDDDVLLIRRAFERAKILNPLHVASNGEEAVAYLKGEGKYSNRDEYPLPDLVLLDLKMPGLNGFDVLQWIRRQPGFASLRVVVLTSSDQMRDVNEAYHLGANSYLVKPTEIEDFVALTRAISGYWLWISKAPETSRPERKGNFNSAPGN